MSIATGASGRPEHEAPAELHLRREAIGARVLLDVDDDPPASGDARIRSPASTGSSAGETWVVGLSDDGRAVIQKYVVDGLDLMEGSSTL